MSSWMLHVVLSAGSLAPNEGFSSAHVSALVLEAAGITLAPVPDAGAARTRGVFTAPHFTRIEWSDDPLRSEGRVEFALVPGTEHLFGAEPVAVGASSFASWRRTLAVATWGPASRTLVLRQSGDGAVASGSVSIALPASTRERHGLETLEVHDVLTGCAMRYGFELPLVLSSEPRELRFEWDLHSVVNVDGVYTAFASRIGDLPRLPIELRVEHPAVTFDRTRVEFRDDSDSALEVRSAPGRTLRIEKVTCPACVALVDADAPDGPYRMTFRESPLASRRHHCSPVQIEAFVGDDPEPFVRHVPVVHRRGIVEPDGTRALYGVFAPGEQLELLRDERGHLRIGYPQRVPCMVDAVESSARALEATFEVPQEPGALDVRIAGASGTIHLSGRIDSRAHQELAHWSEVCD